MPGGDNSPNWANSGGTGMAEMQNFLKLLDLGTHFLRLLICSVFMYWDKEFRKVQAIFSQHFEAQIKINSKRQNALQTMRV